MYRLSLHRQNNLLKIKKLLSKWTDDKNISQSLIIVKISEAFSMYHQVSSAGLTVHHYSWRHLHPVLINDLDTDFSALLTLNVDGKIIHFYLIDDQGHLERNDALKGTGKRKANQEYLDYFYVIAKNTENSKDP